MNITSILTAAAIIIAVTVPNVGAVQRAEYPAAAQHGDATPPLDGPRDIERTHVLPPEHGGTSAHLAGDVLAGQGVRSLGRGEEGRHVRGGPSSVPLVGTFDEEHGRRQQRGLVRGADYVSDEMRRDLHHIETVGGLIGNPTVSYPINSLERVPWLLVTGVSWILHFLGALCTTVQQADLLVFEECVGKSKRECLLLIEGVLTTNPEFMSVASFDEYVVDALRARNYTDPD